MLRGKKQLRGDGTSRNLYTLFFTCILEALRIDRLAMSYAIRGLFSRVLGNAFTSILERSLLAQQRFQSIARLDKQIPRKAIQKVSCA